MKELVLTAGSGSARQNIREAHDSRERLVVYWDAWDAPDGISLPTRLAADFERIRAEHAAWAYEMGMHSVNGREVREHLSAGGRLSMWWCSLLYERHPKMTPGLYTVYRLRALELLMDAEGATDVRLTGPSDNTLRVMLKKFCAASSRHLIVQDEEQGRNKDGGLLVRLYRATPAPLRALARYMHWWWTVRRRLPFAGHSPLPSAGESTATIATYFPNIDMEAAKQGRFRSRYFESLHDALKESGKSLRWLFVRFPAPDISLAQCIALRNRFREEHKDGISFHYLEEFLSFSDILAAFARWQRLVIVSLRLERRVRSAFCFAGSRVNFWPVMGQYWAESFRGWRCLERCLQYQAFLRWTRLAGPQQWTLFPLENCPWERMLTHAVHSADNGPVLGAVHSTLRPTDLRFFDDPRTFDDADCKMFHPDAVRANGQSARAQWLKAGVPQARLGMAEALRYLYLAKNSEEKHRSTAILGKPQLLVVTGFFADEADDHLRLLAGALLGGLLDAYDVVIKPHPYLPIQEKLRTLLGKRAHEIREVQGAVAECLRPGVIVWASNSTTVALEAAVRGLPVMVMPPPKGDFDLSPTQDIQGIVRTATLKDVRQGLTARALDLPPDYFLLDPALTRWREWLGLDQTVNVSH